MKLDRTGLQERYEALSGQYQGYIQMSAGRITTLLREAAPLPSWRSLHTEPLLFIFEAALYDSETKHSILIRQIDNGWMWTEVEVDWDNACEEDKTLFYSVFDDQNHKELRMVQIWEKRADPISEGFESLEPVGTFFAGFDFKGGQA